MMNDERLKKQDMKSKTHHSTSINQHSGLIQHHTSFSPEQTHKLGKEFGKRLPENSVVCFFGDLAAGKTTFIKGLAAGAAEYRSEEVNSPTFVYMNIYEGEKTIYHFDLYRLNGPEEFLMMGFDEYFDAGGISCIEWSERISSLLSSDFYRVVMTHEGGDARRIAIHN